MATISFDSTDSGKTPKHPLEVDVQKACWSYLGTVRVETPPHYNLQACSFMVPNGTQLAGGRQRRAMYMSSLKAQGFKPGVSDLVIAYPIWGKATGHCIYTGAYIELKRDPGAYKGPKALATALRPEQRDWLQLMESVGYWTGVAYGVDDFKRHVKNFLAGKSPRALDLFDWLGDTESAQ